MMKKTTDLNLNSLTNSQLSDRELFGLTGGEPGIACSGGGCKGAGIEANVDRTMKNLREVNPPPTVAPE